MSERSNLRFVTLANQETIDDPETFSGLPVSLQLVGRRFEDEKVLAVLDYIKQAIGLPFVDFP